MAHVLLARALHTFQRKGGRETWNGHTMDPSDGQWKELTECQSQGASLLMLTTGLLEVESSLTRTLGNGIMRQLSSTTSTSVST